jgi:solute carrier family 13 (sodium-dependent dicarboxylate transporter), member 2/3/5
MKAFSSKYIGFFVVFGILIAILTGFPDDMFTAKIALIIFVTAIAAWTLTDFDATYIAVLATFAMAASGVNGDKMVLSGLGDPFIVFVIAGFMLGGAYKSTGLSERIAHWFAVRSRRVGQLFYLITAALVVLSFVVPSTSARAAMLMPVYMAVAAATDNKNIRKGLAILFPTIIVLSCITSYLGAGANIMTVDFIQQFSGKRISYFDWLVLGAPFGIISCFLSTWVILRLFLSPEERLLPFSLPKNDTKNTPLSIQSQKRTLSITALLIGFWTTEQWHHIDAAMVALGGALLLCLPSFGVMTFKQSLKEVEWNLVVFMAATIELSQGLTQSGALTYLINAFNQSAQSLPSSAMLTFILIVALLSHLVVHSRTARAAVMMPILIPLGISAGQSGLLVAFFANAAMGYCLTLPICAKPVALFSTAGNEGYTSSDLMRLSAWLLPLHLVLLLAAFSLYGRFVCS